MIDGTLRTVSEDLYRYLVRRHWNGRALAGPDPGIRFNSRIGRFLKSYLSFVPWDDDLSYMQGQGYWIFTNWCLSESQGDWFRETALANSEFIKESQRADGAWDYPNPEWSGRVATVEGCFAAMALIESFKQSHRKDFLESALLWNGYLESDIGYRRRGGVNYFAHQGTGRDAGGVPNNSSLVLWYLARLSDATDDESYLERAPQLVSWLKQVQLPTGELPYKVSETGDVFPHFLCFNYNSFQFLDLVDYFELTGDEEILPVLEGIASFLQTGIGPEGAARYECGKDTPVVLYYSAALARALSQATALGMADANSAVDQTFRWLSGQQQPDGNFSFYSKHNYGMLSDRRSYPRYLAMILYHVVSELASRSD